MALANVDHVQDGLALLISQHQDKPRIAALLSSYLRRIQELDDAAIEVMIARLIDNAVDHALIVIGRIVGQVNEGGWDDNTFRLFIKARIRANKSNGHGDDIIDVINLIEAADFVLSEVYPASMFVEFDTVTAADPLILIELARRAKGAGIRLQMLYGDHDIGIDGFSFCGGTTEDALSAQGFADTGQTVGGYLSGVIE